MINSRRGGCRLRLQCCRGIADDRQCTCSGRRVQPQFERIATFVVCENSSCDTASWRRRWPRSSQRARMAGRSSTPTVRGKAIGLVDITDPAQPKGLGTVKLEGRADFGRCRRTLCLGRGQHVGKLHQSIRAPRDIRFACVPRRRPFLRAAHETRHGRSAGLGRGQP